MIAQEVCALITFQFLAVFAMKLVREAMAESPYVITNDFVYFEVRWFLSLFRSLDWLTKKGEATVVRESKRQGSS